MYIVQEYSKKTKLLDLFNTLEEADKEIIITMSESLAEKCKTNRSKIAGNIAEVENENHIVCSKT